MQKIPDNAEETFKCSRCGHMFGREGQDKAACPQCGFVCTEANCAVLGSSNEEY